jgi:uncharacterized protein YpmB
MLTKYLLITIGVLVLALALAGFTLRSSYRTNGKQAAALVLAQTDLAQARKDLVRTRAISNKRVAESQVALRQAQALRQGLDAAIGAQPEWADTPVPQEVIDALQ